LSREALPLFALLGIGQSSTLIGGQSLIAKIAPVDIRGSVIGVFGFFGAIGMMLTSLAGGRMFDGIGPWAPFVAVGILQGLLFVVAFLLRGQDKTPVAPVASE
jgi:MFS family permease